MSDQVKPKTPEEAMELTKAQQAEADSWAERVDRLMRSFGKIQRENGLAPRLAATYGKGK